MKTAIGLGLVASAALLFSGCFEALAQQPPPQSPNMTFFVTGFGPGKGADLGGIEGADRYCQELAQRAGAGDKTWHAYLSTQAAEGSQPSTRAIGSAAAPGRTSEAKLSPKALTIFTATITSSTCRRR
jgi:hypothetical protein